MQKINQSVGSLKCRLRMHTFMILLYLLRLSVFGVLALVK